MSSVLEAQNKFAAELAMSIGEFARSGETPRTAAFLPYSQEISRLVIAKVRNRNPEDIHHKDHSHLFSRLEPKSEEILTKALDEYCANRRPQTLKNGKKWVMDQEIAEAKMLLKLNDLVDTLVTENTKVHTPEHKEELTPAMGAGIIAVIGIYTACALYAMSLVKEKFSHNKDKKTPSTLKAVKDAAKTQLKPKIRE